jgi:hypothetical protein
LRHRGGVPAAVKVVVFSQELEKARRFKREKARVRRMCRNIEPLLLKAAAGLIEELAWQRVTLEGLRRIVDEEGVLDVFEQGGDIIVRRHPAAKAYAAMVQRYCTTSKLLTSLLPVGGHDVEDELMRFVRRRGR